MEAVKINALEVENVKRIKAVQIIPSANGLTVIGGNNGQGKTSVLDAIAWALGGDRLRPSNPMREGSYVTPQIKVTLSNGLVVERSGKNSSLKVTDPGGNRSGQRLLDDFVEELAINLPKFMESSSREKAGILLQIIGVGDQLASLELQEKEVYNQRRTIGQVADQKKKFAKELPVYPEAPNEPVSITDLIQRQQAILARNGENQRKRLMLQELTRRKEEYEAKIKILTEQLQEARKHFSTLTEDVAVAEKDALELRDESTEALENDIRNIEAINIKVRANCDRERAEQDAAMYESQYDSLTEKLESIRQNKHDLLIGAKLPLDGLSVEDGELTYLGKKWDCMSSSEQLRVSTAIVRALNPKCGFVLLDKLEQMDLITLKEFGEWLEREGLQAIATRVSTGGECSVIIEDGYSSEPQNVTIPNSTTTPKWKAGEF